MSAALSLLASSGSAWAAGNWTVHVATVNAGEAKATTLPTAPTATASCATPTSGKKVTVTWTAVTHATTYGVYQSGTVNGTHIQQTSVSTTTWTSAALAAGNYFYEVIANVGSNWASAKSAATAQRTITSTICS